MSVFGHPVVTDAVGYMDKDVTGQMWNTHPWKDKKLQVIGDEVKILFPLQSVPADE